MNFFELLSPILAAVNILDGRELIRAFGYIGLLVVIFAESGLLIGFFLPGDSLLFTAGIAASAAAGKVLNLADDKPLFDIYLLIPLCFIAAVAGDSVGYLFGQKVGPRIFNREDSLFFQKKHIQRAQAFYETHGGKTIILARFLPIVRTFAPIVAGVGKMKYSTFLTFNLIGGALWTVGLTLAGYFLGSLIPPDQVDKYLIPIILLIIFLSIAPTAWHILKEKETRDQIMTTARRIIKRESPTGTEATVAKVEEAKLTKKS